MIVSLLTIRSLADPSQTLEPTLEASTSAMSSTTDSSGLVDIPPANISQGTPESSVARSPGPSDTNELLDSPSEGGTLGTLDSQSATLSDDDVGSSCYLV
jgi:hypothetical protein